jgi:precorrin-6B methylase 2
METNFDRFPQSIAGDGRRWYAGKEFTADWFSRNLRHWVPILEPRRRLPVRVLEIGSHEGHSAIFWLEYLPESNVTCIDLFAGEYELRFDRNLAQYGSRVEKIKSNSVVALEEMRKAGRRFDVIYIDGSHKRYDVLCDTLLAWPLLNIGGLLIWDDYGGNRLHDNSKDMPHKAIQAIDLFCSKFSRCFRVRHQRYQKIIEKTAEWPLATKLEAIASIPSYLFRRAKSRLQRK